MSAPPVVFDRQLVRGRWNRAAERIGDHDFLFAAASDALIERLDFMRRDFSRILVLGARDLHLAARMASRPGVESLVEAGLSAFFFRTSGGMAVVADEEWLPFDDHAFDLVLAPLSLHAVNDLPGALIQIRRALRPDGLLLAALFGGETLTELRRAFGEAEAAVEGGMSPRVMPSADLGDLAGLMQRAGFALPVVDSERYDVSYADPLALMRELRGMGEANALAARRRTFLRRATLAATCEIYRRNFAEPDGRIRATFEVYSLAAWAPGPNQPKPLRPGRATTRLADALGTVERKTGDKPTPG